MKLTVMFGVDLSAYAVKTVEFGHEPTEAEILEWARRQYESGGIVFEPEWESACSARVVEVFGEEGSLHSDLTIDPQYLEAGLTAELALHGKIQPRLALEYTCQSLGLDLGYADAFIQKIKEL